MKGYFRNTNTPEEDRCMLEEIKEYFKSREYTQDVYEVKRCPLTGGQHIMLRLNCPEGTDAQDMWKFVLADTEEKYPKLKFRILIYNKRVPAWHFRKDKKILPEDEF